MGLWFGIGDLGVYCQHGREKLNIYSSSDNYLLTKGLSYVAPVGLSFRF